MTDLETSLYEPLSQPSNLVYMPPEGESLVMMFLVLSVIVVSECKVRREEPLEMMKTAATSIVVVNRVTATGFIRMNGETVSNNTLLFDCLIDPRFTIGFTRHKDSGLASVVICLLDNHPTGLRDCKVTVCFAKDDDARNFVEMFKMFQQEMRPLIDEALQKEN